MASALLLSTLAELCLPTKPNKNAKRALPINSRSLAANSKTIYSANKSEKSRSTKFAHQISAQVDRFFSDFELMRDVVIVLHSIDAGFSVESIRQDFHGESAEAWSVGLS